MKRAYEKSQYAKPCEQYCREVYPHEAKAIFQKAEEYYLAFLKTILLQETVLKRLMV